MSRLFNIINTMAGKVKANEVKTITQTVTTGSTGNANLSSIPTGAKMVTVQTAGGSYMGVPFKSGSDWYAKVFAWNNASWSVAANTSVTVTANYIVGGGRKSLNFRHFFVCKGVAA